MDTAVYSPSGLSTVMRRKERLIRATTWMNLRNILLRERSQTQKKSMYSSVTSVGSSEANKARIWVWESREWLPLGRKTRVMSDWEEGLSEGLMFSVLSWEVSQGRSLWSDELGRMLELGGKTEML